MYFLETEGVALLDGSAYGLSPYLRLSIAAALPLIEEACTRMARAVAALS
jgi:aspartate aminotransferase